MSKHQHIFLEKSERTKLEQLIKSGTHSARVIARARTLLLLDRSQGQKRKVREVVEAAMVSPGTVSNLKKRYFAEGLGGTLYEKSRPGAKPKIDGEVEAHLIALTCSDPPEGYDHWTLRLLADR
ncbi:MAG: helix-turn-helix domain-containing protein, partial [Chloroflexi bacterium]|nr:helix-turn-helix domain-containing protein [Chloroflexota bacterium]